MYKVELNLCGGTILKLETSGGIVLSSKKHWSPGGEVSVQSVERSDSGGWIVSGSLTPNGICPDCIHADVTAGGVGGCRIIPGMETR